MRSCGSIVPHGLAGEKVRIAGEVVPANLRPNNTNPFGDLYKLLSIGLHDRTDDECCEIVDAMDDSLKFIYAQLKTHMEASKDFEAGWLRCLQRCGSPTRSGVTTPLRFQRRGG
jgi:hypothetical protein